MTQDCREYCGDHDCTCGIAEARMKKSEAPGESSAIKCSSCGKFISHEQMMSGDASYHFEPDSHRGPEVSEWTCRECRFNFAPGQDVSLRERPERKGIIAHRYMHCSSPHYAVAWSGQEVTWHWRQGDLEKV